MLRYPKDFPGLFLSGRTGRGLSNLQVTVSSAATAQQIHPCPRTLSFSFSPGSLLRLLCWRAQLSRTGPGLGVAALTRQDRANVVSVQVPTRVPVRCPGPGLSSVCPLCVRSTPVMSERHNCIRGREEREVKGQRRFWCFGMKFCR